MKLFEYSYSIPYGSGCGVIIAKNKDDALKMVLDHPYEKVIDLEIQEIDIQKPQILDHSWSE